MSPSFRSVEATKTQKGCSNFRFCLITVFHLSGRRNNVVATHFGMWKYFKATTDNRLLKKKVIQTGKKCTSQSSNDILVAQCTREIRVEQYSQHHKKHGKAFRVTQRSPPAVSAALPTWKRSLTPHSPHFLLVLVQRSDPQWLLCGNKGVWTVTDGDSCREYRTPGR